MSVVHPTATGAALDALLAAQSPSGAFGSIVDLPTGPAADENGFVTALVLHELSAWPATPALTAARMRALDFLACCERTDRRGAFSFYPPDRQPAWMPIALLPDADDTALFTLALVNGGRWPAQRLTHAPRHVLESFRLRWIAADAKPWHRDGVYLTWLDELVYPNVVDLCVNINVAALLKRAGPEHAAGLAAIVDMVDAGLTWAGASPQRAFLLMPYYPHPAELGHAIDRAIRLGVTELLPCRDKLRDLGWSYAADPAGWPLNTPVCSSDDGRIVWRAPVLQQARQLCRRRDARAHLQFLPPPDQK